jgi:glycosyltransferase involved in cell wall biosynthesis
MELYVLIRTSGEESGPRAVKPIIIVCAYNEASRLPRLLNRLVGRDLIVVNDGSTDDTERVLVAHAVPYLSHPSRWGKSRALTAGLQYARANGYDVVAEIGADAIPKNDALDLLFRALQPADVGGASAHQIAVGKKNFAYFVDDVFWSTLAEAKYIQQIRTGSSHLGAVTWAIRLLPEVLSEDAVNDDEFIGATIRARGLKTVFVRDAVVYFDASSSLAHIIERRRRMYYGHLVLSGSTAPSTDVGISLWALARAIRERPMRVPFALPAMMIELLSHALAASDRANPEMMNHYRHWVTSWPKRDFRNPP